MKGEKIMLLKEIETRRSIRKYTDDPVTEEQIREILEAAFWAPTARNKQEWRFFVVTNRGLLTKMAECNPYAAMTKDCAFAVVVGYEEGVNDRFGEVDCGAAIENMLLQAHHMGIGSVWCALMPGSEREADYRRVLDLPDSFRTVASVQFGVPAEERSADSRFDEAKVTFLR